MSNDVNEMLAAIFRPNPVEIDYSITRIEGEIPRELNGTLYRNGPNQRTAPNAGSRALSFFDGDALIHAIVFDDGKAVCRSRYAQTESFLREQAEGVHCMAGYLLPADKTLRDPPPVIQPHTNIVPHAGRLFAMVESAPPFEMTPTTLESIGLWKLDGKMLGRSTTAHPKVDARTGQMWIQGYQAIEPYIQLYAVEGDGRVSLAEGVDAPWPAMMHDFAITQNYVIFPLQSTAIDGEALASGAGLGRALRSQPDVNLQFGIRRREAGSEVQWFEAGSPSSIFHIGNAYEEDGKIFMDACTYDGTRSQLGITIASIRNGGHPGGLMAHPYLYVFDLAAGTCAESKLSDDSADFPRIDDRLVGYKNRWGYAATAEPGEDASSLYRRITRSEREGGRSIHRPVIEGQWVGEPVFVARDASAAEDDGFVLNFLFDAIRDRSAIDILDARAIDAEPLARCWLEERVPFGFHGNWLPAP